jgi:Mg-chelatase subunit ChlD
MITIHNLLILDESGSMHSIYDQALSGANETIQSIRAAQQNFADQDQRFTFVTFNTVAPNVKTVIDDAPIGEVRDLTENDYHPCACTPLYDAMGISISTLERKVKEGDRVLVTVITDGLENASREYDGKAVKEMVGRLREKGWTFVYIGANQDAVEVARRMDIHNSLNFCSTAEGTRAMFDKHRRSKDIYYEKMRRFHDSMASDEDFFNEKAAAGRVTPDHIDRLAPGQIFVFGSNLQGAHGGGAAALAHSRFGAVWGQGVGLQGRSYAIPTMQGGVDTIKPYVDEFIRFAAQHPEMTFLVTRIGCGIAGFSEEEIAPLFSSAVALSNVWLPAGFWRILNR